MNDRARLLRSFVEATTGPAEYGVSDCSTFAAQWVATVLGRDVEWPDYASLEEAQALIDARGGLVEVWRDVARATGLRERDVATEPPAPGDIGVIRTRVFGPVGIVFGMLGGMDGGPWLAHWRAEKGVRMMPVRRSTLLAVWEV